MTYDLTFSDALRLAKLGRKVRRTSWAKECIMYKDKQAQHPTLICTDLKGDAHEWVPSQNDMFAKDWKDVT